MAMKIWVILYNEKYECSDVFVEAYDNQVTAETRAVELNNKLKNMYSSYSISYYSYTVEEYELNTHSR